jgi:hypothetical protein
MLSNIRGQFGNPRPASRSVSASDVLKRASGRFARYCCKPYHASNVPAGPRLSHLNAPAEKTLQREIVLLFLLLPGFTLLFGRAVAQGERIE